MPNRRWPGSRFVLALVVSALFLTLVARTLFVPRSERSGPGSGSAPARLIPPPAGTGEPTPAREPGRAVRTEPSETPGSAFLSGRVLDPEGAPAAGARVLLRRAGEVDPTVLLSARDGPPSVGVAQLALAHAQVIDEGVSGQDGRFSFQPAPGRYLLVVRADDAPSWVSAPLDLAGRHEIEVSLAEGLEIQGKVLDHEGRPFPGAEVSAALVERDRLGGETLPFFPEDLTTLLFLDEALRAHRSTCGEGGIFRVSGLLDFKYDLRAQARGRRPPAGGQTPSEGRASAEGTSAEVRGVRGGDQDVEIFLEAGRAVRGRVVLFGGKPAEGAIVTLFRAGEPPPEGKPISDSLTGAPASQVVTGSGGEFESPPLSPGAYHLRVEGKGLQKTAADFLLDESSESLELEIAVRPGRRLQGRITSAKGAPLAEMEVRIAEADSVPRTGDGPEETSTGEGSEVILRTDRDGRFVANTLREGKHHLEVAACPPYSAFRQDVAPGQQEVLITLPEGSPVFIGRAVEAETGKPLPLARATVHPAAESAVDRQEAPLDRQEAIADADGRFRFFSARGGKARVEVQSSRHLTATTPELVLDPTGPPVEVTLELPRAGFLTGTVVIPTGEPLPGAKVLCSREALDGAIGWASWTQPAITNADGAFALSLSKARPGATYWLSVTHPRYFLSEDLPVEVEDPAHGVADVKVTVRPASLLRGTVTLSGLPARDGVVRVIRLLGESQAPDPAESPASGTGLHGASLPGIAEAEAQADPKGRFEVSGLRPGTYRVTAEARGSAPYRGEPFSLAEGIEMVADIALDPEKTIHGTISDAEGNSLEGARVSAVAADASRHTPFPAISDRQGRYTLRGLTSAAYSLRAQKEGFTTEVRPELRPFDGETDFMLFAQGGLRVVVTDLETGHPVDCYFLDLLPDEEGLRLHEDPGTGVISSPAGKFQAARLPPGRYRLLVAARGYLVHESPVVVESGKTAEVTVSLDPGEEIAGTVVSSAGLPVEGAKVLAVALAPAPGERSGGAPPGAGPGPGGATAHAGAEAGAPDLVPAHRPALPVETLLALTDRDGGFTIRGLEAGIYRLEASHDRHLPETSPPVVVPSSSQARTTAPPERIRLVLRPGSTLSGRILSRAGDVLEGVQVELRGTRETRKVLSGERGRYVFHAVPAGTYEISHVRGGAPVESGSVEVPSDDLEILRDIVVSEE